MNRYIVNVIFSQIIMSSLFATTLPAQTDLDAEERFLDLKIKMLEAATANMKKIYSDPNLTEAYYDRLIKELETIKALMNPKSTRTEEQLAALTDFKQRIIAGAAQYGIRLGNTPVAPTAPTRSLQAPAVQLPSVTPNIVQHNPLPPPSANQSEMFMQQGMINQMPLLGQGNVDQQNANVPYPLNMNNQQHYNGNDYSQNYNNPPQSINWDQQQYPNMIQGNNEMNQGYNGMYQNNNNEHQYEINGLRTAPTDPVNSAPNYWSPSDEPNPQLLTSPRTSRNKSTTDSEPDSNTVTSDNLNSMRGRFGNGNSFKSLMDLKQNARGTGSSNITLDDLKKRDR